MEKIFCEKFNGKDIYLYTLKDGDIEVGIYNIGARIHFIKVRGVDITLGFDSMEDYLRSSSYAGSTVGRCGNRIARGKFTLNGKKYCVTCNEGANHLHGGKEGFDKKFFEVKEQNNALVLEYTSEDGEEGYPGNLKFTVTYTLKGNTLNAEYEAVCDKDTLFNPTNHSYFNLDGEQTGDCRDNLLQIFADKYTLVDGELIPTGKSADVAKTAFDFRKLKAIRTDFGDGLLKATNGYDHNFILNGGHAAHVESAKTGITMDLYTDMPCMQLYTGGSLCRSTGKTVTYDKWAGFCLEPQFAPNAINTDGEKQPVLEASKNVKHFIRYEFN